ncbi:MAG: pantetheine-phosphate adenylyltransferase [Syntrophomonadaceae bacterium]|nr:pantetheine-phosphate adenylyltransferase [Syntrophomonadaceae bacterium]
MKTAVFPGSFDPITFGHVDILERSSGMFDKIIVAVVHHVGKRALFTLEERVEMIGAATRHIPNLEITSFRGLTVDFLRKKQAHIIVRGLRSFTDYEYESQIALYNKHLYPDSETVFILANSNYTYLSSSGVKEAALLGGDVRTMVPPPVLEMLKEKLRQRGELQ